MMTAHGELFDFECNVTVESSCTCAHIHAHMHAPVSFARMSKNDQDLIRNFSFELRNSMSKHPHALLHTRRPWVTTVRWSICVAEEP